MNKKVVLSLSGGMDSASLLIHLLSRGHEVQCVGFDYGQKHIVELDRANLLVAYLRDKGFAVKFNIVELKGLSDLLVSGLIGNDSQELLNGHYSHENAKSSVVPNRNAIFASIVYAVALSEYKRCASPVSIALATHLGDFNNTNGQGTYPDCSEEFKIALGHAFALGNWDSEFVSYEAPFNNVDKSGVLTHGLVACNLLGLDYRDIYIRTNTSYNPVIFDGDVYSDYKTGSSIERIEAFMAIGVEDPLIYADETGLRSWGEVCTYVQNVCADFAK